MKFPRVAELSFLRAFLLFMLGFFVPLIISILMIPFFNYIFVILLLGWIPYSIWLALCYYYKRKDKIIEESKTLVSG
jgi:hypothetical protein